MPRSLRYFLIWLSCTALTATAVFLTVSFVVGSTAPLPPTARGVSTVLATAAPGGTGGPVTVGTPASTPSTPSATGAPTSPTRRPSPTAPAAPTTPRPAPSSAGRADCSGGAGAHSFATVGGQVTVRFGADAVCLVSAVPALGFTTSTAQPGPGTLTVTFTGAHHRSELTATLQPQAQEVTREVSW